MSPGYLIFRPFLKFPSQVQNGMISPQWSSFRERNHHKDRFVEWHSSLAFGCRERSRGCSPLFGRSWGFPRSGWGWRLHSLAWCSGRTEFIKPHTWWLGLSKPHHAISLLQIWELLLCNLPRDIKKGQKQLPNPSMIITRVCFSWSSCFRKMWAGARIANQVSLHT